MDAHNCRARALGRQSLEASKKDGRKLFPQRSPCPSPATRTPCDVVHHILRFAHIWPWNAPASLGRLPRSLLGALRTKFVECCLALQQSANIYPGNSQCLPIAVLAILIGPGIAGWLSRAPIPRKFQAIRARSGMTTDYIHAALAPLAISRLAKQCFSYPTYVVSGSSTRVRTFLQGS